MEQTVPYLLVSVIEGEGAIQVGKTSYPLQKGIHFILPANVTDWTFTGQMELIASHAN
jgi:mannose-6-phosphate isomerase